MNDIEKISKELNNLPKGWIVMLETSAEKMLEVSLSTIKYLSAEKKYIGIIVLASRPQKNLVQLYQQNNIDIKKILILDCISKSQSMNLEEADNVLYLESVSDLTNISIAITESTQRIPGDKFVFIDTINSMLIHNKPEVFAQFIHGILTKMRIDEVNGLLVSLKGEADKYIYAEIAQLCDRIVKI
ncbi:MAG TPA: hypothetical protein DSN98_01950 [Thermoplasmata archaeon]|jgi:hypothetical protein|nr:MAG TPA: hypothetical protein DSN98_01950 [Thermoplasmata archaeon]